MLQRIRTATSGDGMAARAIRSSGFTVLKLGGQNFLRLASNLVLTRLLFPEAFGIMAIVQVVLTGVAMFSDFGIKGSIVQDERGDDPDFLNTAWTFQILRGFVLGVIVLLAAGPIAEFYETPILADLLMVAAIVPVIQGFASTRLATASRKLFIGRMVMLHLGAQFVGILVMIALAWWLESVWALVIGSLVSPFLVTSLSHVVIPGIRNRIMFERDALGRLFGFGKYIFLATIAGFFVGQGDKAILGKFVSLSDLAIYNIAFFLASVPVLLANALNQAVIFPLYARRPPSASENNRRKINKARFLTTAALVGALCCLAFVGDWLVRALYDSRYYGAGPLMILIALAALPRVVVSSYAALPMAAGDSGRFALLMTAGAILHLGSVFLGAQNFGVVGVAVAPVLASVLFYPVAVLTARRYKGWDPLHDALFHAIAVVAGAAIFWLHSDLLMEILRAAGLFALV